MDQATDEMPLVQLLAGHAGPTAQVASGDAQQQQLERAMAEEDFAAIPGLLSGSHSTVDAIANIWQAVVTANRQHIGASPVRRGDGAHWQLPPLDAVNGHSTKQEGLYSGQPWKSSVGANGMTVGSVGASGAAQPAGSRRGAVPLPEAFGTARFLRAVAAGYHAKGEAPQRSLPPRDRPLVPLAPSVTTLTVRKIPPPYTQDELLQEWPAAGSFDYLHFPYSEGLGRSVSIAFINFLTPELAACFYERWHGRRLARHPSSRSLVVEASRVQGRNANLALVHEDARVLPVVSFGDEYLGGQRLLRMVELAKVGVCTARV